MKPDAAEKVMDLVERIRPILAGKGPEVQSAVLADLTAQWLCGHIIPGEEEQTQTMRAHLLAEFCQLVRQLVPVNEKFKFERFN